MDNLDNLDLNIDNYDLTDILKLFKMPDSFDDNDMKNAKKIVLKTHPDKSGLDSRFFIFYSKAYKMLYHIWEFQNKSKKSSSSVMEYSSLSVVEEDKKKIVRDHFFNENEKKNTNFNIHLFNEYFIKNKIENENQQKGYGNWLKETEQQPPEQVFNERDMKLAFEKKKAEAREKAIVLKKNISELCSPTSACELLGEGDFNSDIFSSSLPYQDLYEAHTHSVIPVTEEDFNAVKKYNNVDEYIRFRSNQGVNLNPLSEKESLEYFKYQERENQNESVKRAFELAKQTEMAQQKNNEFWSYFQMLRDK